MSHRIFALRALVALLFLFLGACATSPKLGGHSPALANPVVWADDGSEVAFVVNTHTAPPGMKGDPNTYRHRLLAQKADGSEQRTVTPPRPYKAINLYYMKKAGYLVVESDLGDGHVKIDRIAVYDGTEIPIIETRGPKPCTEGGAYLPNRVLPSPQGDLLAHAYSNRCGEITVDFLDARNLFAQASQTLAVTQTPTLTWHPHGYLIIALPDGTTAWELRPGGSPLPAAYPPCLAPPTTSSAISARGQRLSLEGDQVRIETGDAGAAFGCQKGTDQ